MNDRTIIAAQILAGLCANPAIFAANAMSGWKLVNCSDADLAAYADHLAAILISTTKEPK